MTGGEHENNGALVGSGSNCSGQLKQTYVTIFLNRIHPVGMSDQEDGFIGAAAGRNSPYCLRNGIRRQTGVEHKCSFLASPCRAEDALAGFSGHPQRGDIMIGFVYRVYCLAAFSAERPRQTTTMAITPALRA